MVFGWRRDTVVKPAAAAAERSTTADPANDSIPTPAAGSSRLELVQPDARELQRMVAQLSDDGKWLAERFEKLQNRVTSELREIRREVDRYFDEGDDDG